MSWWTGVEQDWCIQDLALGRPTFFAFVSIAVSTSAALPPPFVAFQVDQGTLAARASGTFPFPIAARDRSITWDRLISFLSWHGTVSRKLGVIF